MVLATIFINIRLHLHNLLLRQNRFRVWPPHKINDGALKLMKKYRASFTGKSFCVVISLP